MTERLVAMAFFTLLLSFLLLAAMLATVSVMAIGAIGMARGGAFETAGIRSNRLMRLRIVFHAVALILFALLALLAGGD